MPTAASTGPTIALNYAMYETLRDLHMSRHPGRSEPPPAVALAFGSLTGLTSSLLLYPTDLVRRKIQLDAGTAMDSRVTFSRCAVDIFRREGVRGFYHGFQAEAYKVTKGLGGIYLQNICKESANHR